MEWIIGDIHGCIYELEALLDRIPGEDRLCFVGDYIDRGPDSARVVNRLLREKDRSVFLTGNHEAMLMAYFHNPGSPEGESWTFMANGGQKTLRSYGLKDERDFLFLPKSHQEFYKSLKTYYEDDEFIVVHAGVRVLDNPDIKIQNKSDLLWIREEWINNENRWTGKKIYYGHTPTRYIQGFENEHIPLIGKKSVGIDTGCVYGGYLTAICPQNDEIVQVKSQHFNQ